MSESLKPTPYVQTYLDRFRAKMINVHDRACLRESEALPGWTEPEPDAPDFTPEQMALIEVGSRHIGDARQAEREGRHEDTVAALGAFLRTYKALLQTLPDAPE